jgi:hypothetical protein
MTLEATATTTNVWLAAVALYLYGEEALCAIRDIDGRKSSYTLGVPQSELDELEREYDVGRCSLADAKTFVHAFNRLTQTQRQMRRDGDREWSSVTYVAAKSCS